MPDTEEEADSSGLLQHETQQKIYDSVIKLLVHLFVFLRALFHFVIT